MVNAQSRLSVPPHPHRPPRELEEHERTALLAVADTLIPGTSEMPTPSAVPAIAKWLDRALAARDDAFEGVVALAIELAALDPNAREAELRRLCAEAPASFADLSSVLAGTYLMVPEVRQAIGYPGQVASHPAFDEAAEEIMDGILDPVLERGSIYVAPPDLAEAQERVAPHDKSRPG